MINFFKRITGIAAREQLEKLTAELAEKTAQEAARKAAEDLATARAAAEKLASKTPKEIATEVGEPWVNINSVTIDPTNPGQGAFELDWNEFFVAKLVRSGYMGKDDEQIVDQWFQDVCRNVVLETYEQYAANYPQGLTVQKKDLGGGRTEIS